MAAETGQTKSFYAREAFIEYIGDLEDLYLAETVWPIFARAQLNPFRSKMS